MAGVADLDNDGHPDLVLQYTDGTVGVWYLGSPLGNQITGFTPITTPGYTNWKEMTAH